MKNTIKNIFIKIPKLPLSALMFYLFIILLWKLAYIPSPTEIIYILKGLYDQYGLIGLFISSFLEGIVYIGLYFPGSFVVALAVILSDGTFISLFSISIVVAIALTITSIINYYLGNRVLKNKINKDLLKEGEDNFSKGLLFSMLHPNILAFYFFNSGIKSHNFLKVIFVPIIMIPFGLVLGYVGYLLRDFIEAVIENPYKMIVVIIVWLIIAYIMENRKRKESE